MFLNLGMPKGKKKSAKRQINYTKCINKFDNGIYLDLILC